MPFIFPCERSIKLIIKCVNVFFTSFIYYFIIVLFIVISYIGGQETLYCSHETLHKSMQEPTVFLQISGNYN